MALVENIFGAIILIFLFIIGGIFLLNLAASQASHSKDAATLTFEDDLYNNNLNTILHITEPETKRPIGNLLPDVLAYREEVFDHTGVAVNVTNETKQLLNQIIGEDRYYLEVLPEITDVGLHFVVDGSNSLREEREELAQNLIPLVRRAQQGNRTVSLGVHILTGTRHSFYDDDPCDPFELAEDALINATGVDLFCTRLNGEVACNLWGNANRIYPEPPGDEEEDEESFGIEVADDVRVRWNITPPYDYSNTCPYDDDFPHWYRETTDRNAYYAESDWGSGVAWVSANEGFAPLSRLVMIFPISDELSTSSVNNRCFTDVAPGTDAQVACDLCEPSCDGDAMTDPLSTEWRSWRSVSKAMRVAQEYHHIIDPIFAYQCNYQYVLVDSGGSRGWNDYLNLTPDGGLTSCSNDACGGCSEQEGGSTFDAPCPSNRYRTCTFYNATCFHPECEQEILRQMEAMAGATGGQVINLPDIPSLTSLIDATIEQNLEAYAIRIGERREGVERIVEHRRLPLPSEPGYVELLLWVYTEETPTYS